jgi:hypothetical protein
MTGSPNPEVTYFRDAVAKRLVKLNPVNVEEPVPLNEKKKVHFKKFNPYPVLNYH